MPETAAPDLADFVARLRRAGFRVDTRQYLTACELVLAMARAGVSFDDDVDRFVSYLGPVFCTSVEEQQAFAAEVRSWKHLEPPPPTPPPPPPADTKRRGFSRWRRARWWQIGLLVAIPIALAGALAGFWYFVPVDVRGRVDVQLADGRVVPPSQAPDPPRLTVGGRDIAVQSDGTFLVRVTRGRTVTLEAYQKDSYKQWWLVTGSSPQPVVLTLTTAPIRVATEVATERSATITPVGVVFSGESIDRAIRWQSVLLAAISAAGLAWLSMLFVDRMRRRLALRHLPGDEDAESVSLPVPTIAMPLKVRQLRTAALSLRRPREQAILDLDIRRTVEETARGDGFFVPRYAPRRSMPEYVVLVSRRGPDDHQARVFDALFEYLAGRDVIVDRYSFHQDPRVCYAEASGESFRLGEVLTRHHRATLIVCGETGCAINRSTGEPARWIELTRDRALRIFLTTEAPDRWTSFEFELARKGFVVLPATEAGWRVLSQVDVQWQSGQLFPAPYSRPFPTLLGSTELRWMDRNEPAPDVLERLLGELKAFLGPSGFAWLCACAIYPQVSWPLTLRMRPAAADPAILASLARLPWLRRGFMPAWLRRTLVARIPPIEERRLRADLELLMEELAKRPHGDAQESQLQISRWVGPLTLMDAAQPGSPLRDAVFLGFMAGAQKDPIFVAPRVFKRLFGGQVEQFDAQRDASEEANRSLLQRTRARVRLWRTLHPVAARTLTAIAIGSAAIAPLRAMLSTETVAGAREAAWFVEVPEGRWGPPTAAVQIGVRAFFISRTEVTVGQYRACIDEGGCSRSEASPSSGPDDYPMANVSFKGALEYADWLDGKLRMATADVPRLRDALDGRRDGLVWQVSLPSQAEFERAAQGTGAQPAPWGADPIDAVRANLGAGSRGRPLAVGSLPIGASPFGAMDMWGNVAELTRTLASGGVDSLDPSMAHRALGGSFSSSGTSQILDPGARAADIGFRVVVSPISAPPLTPLVREAARPGGAVAVNAPAIPVQTTAPPCRPLDSGPFPPIYFDFDRSDVNAQGTKALDVIAEQLRQMNGTLIIQGNTATDGTSEYNLSLGQRMATAVRDYLVSRGTPLNRLVTISRGKEYPACPGNRPQDQAMNRRVTFAFTSPRDIRQQAPNPPPQAPLTRQQAPDTRQQAPSNIRLSASPSALAPGETATLRAIDDTNAPVMGTWACNSGTTFYTTVGGPDSSSVQAPRGSSAPITCTFTSAGGSSASIVIAVRAPAAAK